MSSADVVIVGAGLFGSIIAKALRVEGHRVITIDEECLGAASKPAACLMKPSWFSSLGKAVYDPALQLLDELYGVQQVTFKAGKLLAKVHWCSPASILQRADRLEHVSRLTQVGRKWRVTLDTSGTFLTAPTVIVAAGIWTEDLVPVEGGMTGLAGVAYLWPEQHIHEPFVRVWAPYRQLVAFNRGDGLWVGDGTAIKEENWTSDRERVCYQRCSKAVGLFREQPDQLFGVRPYVKQKPCYLKEAEPGLWVATGGAKNGTLAAAWCASEIVKALA
jgi:glycine/D-amino acid oxidase-like deaminating enzyme